MLDLNLREVVSKGKQSVSSALKSKKGELMQVGTMSCTSSCLLPYLFCTFMPVAKVCLYCISSVPSCLLPRYACTVSLLYLHACCQGMLLLHALYSVRYHLRSCVLGLVILTKVKLVSCSVEYTHHSGDVHWIISMVTLFSFA